MFGGVTDLVDTDETLESICLNDMFSYNVDSNRWFPHTLRASKKVKGAPEIDTEDPLPDDDTHLAFPWPRFNAHMCVVKNILYVFGGSLETRTKEITLKDFWSINLEKMIQWDCIIPDDIESAEWKGEDSEDDDCDDSDESASDSEHKTAQIDEKKEIESRLEAAKEKSNDANNAPIPGESLRDFFARTAGFWQIRMLDNIQDHQSIGTVKNIRRNAFEMAKLNWTEWQPKLAELAAFLVENEYEIEETNLANKASKDVERSRR